MRVRLDEIGRRIETLLMSVLLLGIVVLAAAQILLRNVFSYSIYFADDLIRMAVLWLAVVGAVAASRESRHIAIGIVPRYFPESWHKPAAVIANVFAGSIATLLAFEALRFVIDTYHYGDTVLGDLPLWVFQAVMPVGFALIGWRFWLQTGSVLRGRS